MISAFCYADNKLSAVNLLSWLGEAKGNAEGSAMAELKKEKGVVVSGCGPLTLYQVTLRCL